MSKHIWTKKLDKISSELPEKSYGKLAERVELAFERCIECNHCSVEGDEAFCKIRKEECVFSAFDTAITYEPCQGFEPYPYAFRHKLHIKNYL